VTLRTVPAVTSDLRALATRCHRSLETIHTVGYFAPEPKAAYVALGLHEQLAYFPARAAAMGWASAELTAATFYVFNPTLVAYVLPAAWETASPERVVGARRAGVGAALHRVLGDPDVTEALDLARTACAGLSLPARPLYAAHASLTEPAEPLTALWHTATLLREHRGDGHLATLVLADLDPVPALLLHGLSSGMLPFLKATRGWPAEAWSDAAGVLRERGLVTSGEEPTLTEAGTALKAEIEEQTLTAAMAGWEHLGAQGCTRLDELVSPLRKALQGSDIFPKALASQR